MTQLCFRPLVSRSCTKLPAVKAAMTTLAVAAAAVLCGCRTASPGPPISLPPVYDSVFHPINRGWDPVPVWQDEFIGTSIDDDRWVVAQFCGGYNEESQCYTNRLENIQVGGGHLTITARTELPIEDDNDRALRCDGTDISMAGNEVGTVNCPATPGDTPLKDYNYSSARIHTHVPTTPMNPSAPHAWTYGRIEIRARVPFGQGTWPAFWMLPLPSAVKWPRSGEIDILEAVNLHMFFPGSFETDRVQSNVHFCSTVIADLDPNASNDAQAVCQLPCNASKAPLVRACFAAS